MNSTLKVINIQFFLPALFCLIFLIPFSCTDDEIASQVSQDSLELERIAAKLNSAGFDTSEGFTKYKDGYLVEYDIFMTEIMIDEYLDTKENSANGRTEHYVTNNLVAVSGTRTLQIFMDAGFGTFMQNAFTNALARYNALNLNLRFQRTTNQGSADIQILTFYEESNILGFSAGFPTGGNPASPIRLNTYYFNNNSSRADAATVIAHEIGHAIGFRHTDFMNRRFSCGTGGNEGDAGVGAVHVPGTPTTPEANSWMLACSNGGDRPFTPNDIVSLQATYPQPAPPTPQTWDIKITGPNTIQRGACTYIFGGSWTATCGASGSPSNGVLVLNGLTFNPTDCVWNALYGPTSCSFNTPGPHNPTPIINSFSLNHANGSGTQYVSLAIGGSSVTLKVEYTYHP